MSISKEHYEGERQYYHTGNDVLIEELKATKKELAKRVKYLEDFREGVFRMLKDLDQGEMELEAAYNKLKETQNQLIQSSKLTVLGELSAGLAHELNQPLTVIMGLSQNILRQTDKKSAQYEKLKLIADASVKMEQVIKHLRIFSRNDCIAFKPVDLKGIIKDSIMILRELLTSRSIELKMKLNPVPVILGSATRLEQVIINLVANAKDAMPSGGTLTISTSSSKTGGISFAKMSIRDTGTGIPAEIKDRIFDPFFTTKEPGKGTGLGLSISYGIIREHSGDITVESDSSGTVFHIILPAREDLPAFAQP
ncbi:MAG: hypothetical protein HYS21_00795 [Deltaproteobacteria bacterium]|nr:hypothetical protein [Deltaproteobacteria bacterium]